MELSTYLACLANTYAVRGKIKVLCGDSRLAARPPAQPRSLEEMLLLYRIDGELVFVKMFYCLLHEMHKKTA